MRNRRSAGLVQPAAVGAAGHHQAGRCQRDRDGGPHPRPAARDQALDSGRRGHRRCCRTAPRPSAPASSTCRSTLAATIALVMLVVFLFLRRSGADDRGRRHRAAVARRHVRGDVGGRLFDRQHLADGAGDLGRLRGRRRDRDDRERASAIWKRASRPLRAAIEGARQIGFTVVSISISLVAAFIPLLFMGGIVGRMFREFSVTLRLRHRRLDGGVADADADDLRTFRSQAAPSPTPTWLDRAGRAHRSTACSSALCAQPRAACCTIAC